MGTDRCQQDDCSARPSVAVSSPERAILIQQAFRLEWLTVGWMVIEAGVAIWAGVAARQEAFVGRAAPRARRPARRIGTAHRHHGWRRADGRQA